MKKILKIMLAVILCFTLSMMLNSTINVKAVSDNSTESQGKARGATDYYYQMTSWSIDKKSSRYVGTKTVTDSFYVQVQGPYGMSATIGHTESGQYYKYEVIADFTFNANKIDVMGHNLGSVSFKNYNVSYYEYRPI